VLLFWILFNVFVVAMLVLDLGVLNRRSHRIGFREALIWSGVWITLAACFAVAVFFWQGRSPALEFVTGYVIELSLSVDNLFVFLVIFRYFKVADDQQHKVLFWGIVGALVMRGLFILAGVIANMSIYFRPTSLFNTLVMLILLVGGLGLVARALRPHPAAKSE